jgi:hypothetical protein
MRALYVAFGSALAGMALLVGAIAWEWASGDFSLTIGLVAGWGLGCFHGVYGAMREMGRI